MHKTAHKSKRATAHGKKQNQQFLSFHFKTLPYLSCIALRSGQPPLCYMQVTQMHRSPFNAQNKKTELPKVDPSVARSYVIIPAAFHPPRRQGLALSGHIIMLPMKNH